MAIQTYYTFGKPATNGPYPSGQAITTPLPRYIALTRIAAATVFTACVVAKLGWSWPVVVLNIGFAIYTLYKNFLAEDPLVEAFYKIAGSKENFDALPEMPLKSNKTIWENIKELSWNHLPHSVYRTSTPDGRRVMIVKGYNDSIKPDPVSTFVRPKKIAAVMAFVERLGPRDTDNTIIPAMTTIVGGYVFGEANQRFSTDQTCEWLHTIRGTISTDLANKFIAQRRV